MTHTVLLVEDEANYRQVLMLMVSDLGLRFVEAADGVEAIERLESEEIDLVITDLTMPRLDGMELLARIVARPRPIPVVVMTAYASIDSAVEAMRRGAIDYLQKPFDEEKLRLVLGRALKVSDLYAENRRLRDAVETRFDFSSIAGESEVMTQVLRTAGKVAATDANVLVLGESGTGKELLARAIHFNSKRASGPFVAVNSAAIPETLIEAELFGAEAGAYTGATKRRRGRVELARGGTLFLDEIGDLPLSLQPKLLRLLQERTFTPLGSEQDLAADVRFVFATHRDLGALVREGKFREDLLYRISVVPLRLPPLRERSGDVVLLAERFARRVAEDMGRRPPVLAASARTALERSAFPGNVRELANVIERAVILAEGDVLEASDLDLRPEPPPPRPAGATNVDGAPGRFVLPEDGIVLEDVEKDLVRQALERTRGNKSRAAQLLGLTRATLRYRVEKLGLE